MSRFVIQPDRSHLKVRARSTLHPIHGTGPLNGHVDAVITEGKFDLSDPPTGTVKLAFLKQLTKFENLASGNSDF